MKDGARAVSTIMDLLVLLVFFFLMRLDTSFSTTLLLVRDIVDLFCLYCIYNIDSCGLVLCVRRETRVEMNERGVCGSTHWEISTISSFLGFFVILTLISSELNLAITMELAISLVGDESKAVMGEYPLVSLSGPTPMLTCWIFYEAFIPSKLRSARFIKEATELSLSKDLTLKRKSSSLVGIFLSSSCKLSSL